MAPDPRGKDTDVGEIEDGRNAELEPQNSVVDAATKGQTVTGYETLTQWVWSNLQGCHCLLLRRCF